LKSKLLLLFCCVPLFASDPAGFAMWTASDIKSAGKKLAEKVDSARFSSKPLEKFGNHLTMLAHREGDGGAELHEKDADIFIVESGMATLIVGGEVVGAKTTAPNEVRGTSIKNGVEHKLAPGDIVHIAAKTPHQLLLGHGKEFTYFVIKVSE
jgi:mannose-6-phosphate isomerase-like protein (cupin superfamily)